MASTSAAGGRLLSIDVVKGLAALWVLLIHAEAFAGTLAMIYLFNRAAPIFVVLMGVNGELWWRGKDARAFWPWLRQRVRRLYVPMWCAVAVWWGIAWMALPGQRPPLTLRLFVKHISGYLIGIGTGWFVTLAIAVAIGLPVLHFLARRVGIRTVLAIGVVCTIASFTYRYELLHHLGTFGWFVFPPRLAAELTFGMALAPFVATLGWRAAAASIAACAVYAASPLLLGAQSPWQLAPAAAFGASSPTVCAHRLLDLPVTVLLLQASAVAAARAWLDWLVRPLAWLGRESYGIYLGQMVAHNALTLLGDGEAIRTAITPLGYAAVLLAGALAWVFAGQALAAATSRLGGRLHAATALAALALAASPAWSEEARPVRSEPIVQAAGTRAPLPAREPTATPAGPLVLLVGDSTSQGVCRDCPPPPAMSPANALESLRGRLPAGSRWRDLRALSVGVGGSTSGDWVRVRPEVCRFAGKGEPQGSDLGLYVLERACAQGGGLARAVRDVVGETPALALVVLGANDVMNAVPPAELVANLRAIAAELAPATVLVGTPFHSPQPERAGLAGYAEAIRAAGLLSGPDFYAIRLPVDGSLVHLTAGAYAAAAGLWLDKLPP